MGKGKTTGWSANPDDIVEGSSDDLFDPPLVEEAPKALRHIIEEELRALPLAERIDRVLQLATEKNGKASLTEPTLAIRRRRVQLDRHEPTVTLFVASCGEIDSGIRGETLAEAITSIGADMLEKLQEQAEGLRTAMEQVEEKIQLVRGKR